MSLKPLTSAQKIQRLVDLCDTLEDQTHIQTIYFDADGNHYFNAREHKGKLYTRLGIKPKEVKDGNDTFIKADTEIVKGTELVGQKTRKEILSSRPKEVLA